MSANSYSPETRAKLTHMLTQLTDVELLALVPDTKHKTAEGRELLAAELKKRLSPNHKP